MSVFGDDLTTLGGASGWAGAGLLGLVLGWLLLKHLPSKDAQAERMGQDKDKAVAAVVAEFSATVKASADKQDHEIATVVAEHRAVLMKMSEECRAERREMMAIIAQENERDRVARHDSNAQAQKAIAQLFESMQKTDAAKNHDKH